MLYKRIRELREDSDKTQREVAEYLGTSYQYYAVYEKGTSEISFERAIQLADYYNVSLDFLAERTNVRNGAAGVIPEDEYNFANRYRELSPKDKRLVDNLIEAMLTQDGHDKK